ncbi:oxidoreductase [Luteitalea sp. TBR-22]|uniref:Gfo/Idh/MocA family protein n=1 Tax=Luteitalea sp. TBR-22 TaxID=2802971 RepID=UPI001AF5D064|nr:Gfo/Idh/MocA family oxidoreductase [Luteitalea sp. TBR-22]BCS33670.1 oxidoreductase [Luteitalea sp. TBR-22]
MSDQQGGVSRRVFLGAAAGLASVIHRPAFAQPAAPSDQLRLALIGVGGMGTGRLKDFITHPDVRIAAICDVDSRHRDAAIALVNGALGYAPAGEGDFRRLLTRKDIDAVAIQTPDHWHAITAVRAMEAGKDVFVEKPLAYSVAEGRAMADASTRHARVTQMGNHIHNTGRNYRNVVELVRSGALGRIHRVQCWKTWDGPLTNGEPATRPAELDYDFWLGPAPRREYHPLRSHRSFRNFWDYSGGTFIDFWCHIVDVAVWALDLKAPRSVSAMGGRYVVNDVTETPDTMEALLEYPELLLSFSLRPAPPTGFTHMGGIGCVFEGSEATLVTNYGRHEVWVKGKLVEDFPRPAQSIPDSPGHLREFIDAIKARNLETTCNVRYGHRLTKLGLLSNIAYRTGRRLHWDDTRERFVGDDDANRYLSRKFRKPYAL